MGFGVDVLAGLGLKLIGIDRPGLGGSDPDPSKTLQSWVDDIREFLEGRVCGVVGFSQGAPFALALAASGVVSAVAIVSGQDELAHPRTQPFLHPDVAAMVQRVAGDPAAFEKWFSGLATEDGLHDLILAMSSERDKLIYTNVSFERTFRNCLKEGFSQGPGGYVRDLVNTFQRWPFEIEKIATPVDLWYGAQDRSPAHSPDFGATTFDRLGCTRKTRTVDPDEGGSILWTRSRDILTKLSERVHPQAIGRA